jgi:hypothetical protein
VNRTANAVVLGITYGYKMKEEGDWLVEAVDQVSFRLCLSLGRVDSRLLGIP